MRFISLFSGIGGIDRGLESAGFACAAQAEVAPHAVDVLQQRFPGVPNLGDITAIDWSTAECFSASSTRELISSARVSRVSLTPWLASAKDLLTSAICGQKLSTVFAKLSPNGSWVKTSQDSCLPTMDECFPEFLGTWPRWATMRRGVVYELPISERPTEGSGCSSWPTVVANDAEKRGDFDPTRSPGLAASALTWPTPCANDDNKSVEAHLAMKARMKGGVRNTITSLQVAVQAWATPTREDGESSGAHSGVPNTLTSATRFGATPQHRDFRSPDLPENGNYQRKVEVGYGIDLNSQAVIWQTPATDSFRSRGGGRKHEMGLDQQARMFPTPNTRDWKSEEGYPKERIEEHAPSLSQFCHHFHPDQPTAPDGSTSSATGHTSLQVSAKRKLNPCFVEWLMGFPIHWTHAPGGLRRSATRLSRKRRNSSDASSTHATNECVGVGEVPPEGAA